MTLPILIAYIASSAALGGEDSRLLRRPVLPSADGARSRCRCEARSASRPRPGLHLDRVTLIGTLIVIRLAGTIYERSILRMGARVKLREALSRRAAA